MNPDFTRRQLLRTSAALAAGSGMLGTASVSAETGLDIKPAPAPVSRHDQFEVIAAGLGRYTIDVSLPLGYGATDQKYPVILVTDGNLLFDLVQAQVNGRSGALALWPKSIVVGVGYPADEGFAGFYGRRNFDFHGDWDMSADPLGQALQGIFTNLKTAEGKPDMVMKAGGAPRFSAFIREELLPQLAEHYAIDLDARHTLIGDSSGGHYVLRDVYDDKSLFSRYVCISPGFNSAPGSIKALEAAYAAKHKDMEIDLFLCAGEIEIDENPLNGLINFGSGILWVAEQFAVRNYPSAKVHWEVMNNEDHGSIPARGISAGLRSVHGVRPGVHGDFIAEQMAKMMGGGEEK